MGVTTCLGFLSQTAHYLYRSRKPQNSIPHLQENWSQETLSRFNIDLTVTGTPTSESPIIFVGNHISYLDIPILMRTIHEVSFVAKKELSQWPIIGAAARAMKTIFVERESKQSRLNAREAIREGLRQNRRIVIFPSGTTSLQESKTWRLGAFEIAKEMSVAIQPFRLQYTPLRTTAFIDNDLFPSHLLRLSNLKNIKAKIDFANPIKIEDPSHQSQQLQSWTQKTF